MEIWSIIILYLLYKKKERDKFEKILFEEIEIIEVMCNIDFDFLEEKKLKFERLRKEKL